jgi:hypothetical protein
MIAQISRNYRLITSTLSRILFMVALLLLAYVVGANSAIQPRNATLPTPVPGQQLPAVDMAAIRQAINPPQGYTLPVSFGDIGPQLLAHGAIDYPQFVALYNKMGRPLTEQQDTILTKGSPEPVVIDSGNAHFLLNFFWAVGLVNQNSILTQGPMMRGGRDEVGTFASTGGWTLGAKSAVELYASASIISLTAEQQARLEKVASGVYRPCCDNPTHFPDCNHGMAMLGLLELMASRDVSEEAMFTAAAYINAFWFPQQTLELAAYFKASQGLDFAQVDARQLVGRPFSSGSGFQAVHQALEAGGLLAPAGSGGGSCGVR